MPLRDHFHPPVSARHAWEGFHAAWPTLLVQQLFPHLPDGYTAEPRARLGTYFEVDAGGFDTGGAGGRPVAAPEGAGGVATAPWAAPSPTLTIDADFGEQDEYELLVFDEDRGRELVAAVEFVSPANKDRPEHRQLFVAKCAALLQKRVCVVIVDVVTTRRANLYAELLDLVGRSDATFGPEPPAIYAVGCRTRTTAHRRPRLESWAYPLQVGTALPTLPLWLAEDVVVPLELEAGYENTCRLLRIA